MLFWVFLAQVVRAIYFSFTLFYSKEKIHIQKKKEIHIKCCGLLILQLTSIYKYKNKQLLESKKIYHALYPKHVSTLSIPPCRKALHSSILC